MYLLESNFEVFWLKLYWILQLGNILANITSGEKVFLPVNYLAITLHFCKVNHM